MLNNHEFVEGGEGNRSSATPLLFDQETSPPLSSSHQTTRSNTPSSGKNLLLFHRIFFPFIEFSFLSSNLLSFHQIFSPFIKSSLLLSGFLSFYQIFSPFKSSPPSSSILSISTSGAKVLTFLGDNGKQLRTGSGVRGCKGWVKRNERTLIIAIFPTSVVVLDARSGRNDAKKDVEHVEKNVDRLGENIDRLGENVDRLGENIDRLGKGLADTNRMLADTNDTIKKMDGKLTLLEHNQKFMQAFALQSAAKIMKAIGGNRSDREEANQFIKDGEEIMGCMERGGEGFGGGESSTLSGIYADRG